MPAGNWLLPPHHHRVQHLPLVAMLHAQHFKPGLAHDVGELLRLVQPESFPVPRAGSGRCGGPAIALAGVIGGGDSAIGAKTTRVVLESANFQASSIRRTSS